MFKVGSELFTSEGPKAVEKLSGLGFQIFLDLKFHDIPNTVSHAVAAASRLRSVRLVTIHASGGVEMMRAAREAVGSKKTRPKLLGVTILTSLDGEALERIGIAGPPSARVLALARISSGVGINMIALLHLGSSYLPALGGRQAGDGFRFRLITN